MKSFKEFVNEAAIPISRTLYQELIDIERDTVDDHSPNGKKKLADALDKATKRGSLMAIKIDDDVRDYLINNAIPNLDDIARDNENNRVRRALKTLRSKL